MLSPSQMLYNKYFDSQTQRCHSQQHHPKISVCIVNGAKESGATHTHTRVSHKQIQAAKLVTQNEHSSGAWFPLMLMLIRLLCITPANSNIFRKVNKSSPIRLLSCFGSIRCFYVFIHLHSLGRFVYSFGTGCFYLSICLPFAGIHKRIIYIQKMVFFFTNIKLNEVERKHLLTAKTLFQSWLFATVPYSVAEATQIKKTPHRVLDKAQRKRAKHEKSIPVNECQCNKKRIIK